VAKARKVGGPPWRQGEPTLTVSEIASRLAPIAPDVAGTIQRIRHWTRERMMLPVSDLHSGPGKHRRYAADAVYDAAILVVTTDIGMNVSAMRVLVDAITQARFAVPKWMSARSRGEKIPLYLCIARRADMAQRTEIEVRKDPGKPTEDLTIIIDLAKLFSRVGG
jgi:DNA-binding transcriptional MerR regulator